MEISYKGGSSLIIATKKSTVLVDPNIATVGLKNPSVANAVELLTDERYRVDGAELIIDGPGEFETGDFSVRGIAARRSIDEADAWLRSTMYRIETTDFRIGVIGHIDGKLSDDQLEELGVLDILVVPVGGNGFTLDPHDAASIVRKVDPKVVVPVHYEDASVQYEVPQLPLEQFVKELNLIVETVDKYKLKNSAALPEALSIVAVQRT